MSYEISTGANMWLIVIIVKLAFLLALASCDSTLNVSGGGGSSGTSIGGLDRLSAKPGEVVTITGTNLTDKIEVIVNDKPAKFTRIDSKTGTVEIPADVDPGLLYVSFSVNNKAIVSLPIMNGNSVDKMLPVSVPLNSICDSYIIKNESGDLSRGYANCKGQKVLCGTSGQSRCSTTDEFPAVVKGDLAGKILAGKSLIGVNGEAEASCSDSE